MFWILFRVVMHIYHYTVLLFVCMCVCTESAFIKCPSLLPSASISLRQGLSQNLGLVFSWLGWKSASSSNPLVSALLRSRVTIMCGTPACYMDRLWTRSCDKPVILAFGNQWQPPKKAHSFIANKVIQLLPRKLTYKVVLHMEQKSVSLWFLSHWPLFLGTQKILICNFTFNFGSSWFFFH